MLHLVYVIVNELAHQVTGDSNIITASSYDNTDDVIVQYRTRLLHLSDTLNTLKDEFIKLNKYNVLECSSYELLNQQFTTFYSNSQSRAHVLSLYNTIQYNIQSQHKHYSDMLYTKCIKPLDEWQNDNIDINDSLKRVINGKQHVQQLYDKFNKFKHKSQQDVLDSKQLNMLQQYEQQYIKYNTAYKKMREGTISKINDYLATRYIHCDEIFIEYMLLQHDIYTAISNSLTEIPTTVEQYRKQLATERQNIANRVASNNNNKQTNSNINELQQSYNTTANTIQTPKSNTINSVNSNGSNKSYRPPTQQYEYSTTSNRQYTTQHNSSIKRPTVVQSDSDTDDTTNNVYDTDNSDNSSEPYETDTSVEDDDNISEPDQDRYNTKPISNSQRQQSQNSNSNRSINHSNSSNDIADILNFTGQSSNTHKKQHQPLSPNNRHSNTPPRPSNSTKPHINNNANNDNLFDFFSPSNNASQSQQQRTNNTQQQQSSTFSKNSHSTLDFFSANDNDNNNNNNNESTFDFTQARTINNTTNDNNLHTSQSQHSNINSNATQQTKPKKGLDSFDPFENFVAGHTTASNNDINNIDELASRFKTTTVIDENGNTSTTTSTTTTASYTTSENISPYSLPYHDFQIDEKLSQWEKQANQQLKHVRILLSTLHTIIWNNSNWKALHLNELNDYNSIKKAHRKAILTVHPDKLHNAPDDTKRVAQHLFATLNTAFQAFDRGAKQGQLGF